VRFEYVLGFLRLVHFEVLSELKVELRKLAVGDNLGVFLFEVGNVDLLTGRTERQLLFDEFVGALVEQLLDLIVVVESYGDAYGVDILLEA